MSLAAKVKFPTLMLLALVALFAAGCSKKPDEARTNAPATPDTPAIADFSSLDAKSWINGNPISLAEARGKHVILIEAWHPA